ncbi:MAG: carboxypeptidase-like regulatory domain-containing protein, partial [Candidatus Acidiferrales bacterium]
MTAPLLAAQNAPAATAQTAQPAQSAAAPQAQAQGSVDATGFVHTSDGAPVPGATLKLTNNDTHQIWVSWTDESGKFEFPSLTPGHYTIEATQLGFAPVTTETQLFSPPPQPPPMQLALRVATLAQLSAPQSSANPSAAARGQGPAAAGQHGAQNAANGAPAGPGARNGQGQGGSRRGGQLPPGLLNAMQQGLAGGGFQQTDVTGTSEGGDEGINAANAATPPAAGGSSDS